MEALNDAGVMKLAAGTFHSLAQTACSQVQCTYCNFFLNQKRSRNTPFFNCRQHAPEMTHHVSVVDPEKRLSL